MSEPWRDFLAAHIAARSNEWAAHRLKTLSGYVESACESPIEQEMLAALFGAFDYTEPNCWHAFQGYKNKAYPMAEAEEYAQYISRQAFATTYADMAVLIVPQVQIGRYRADFVLFATVEQIITGDDRHYALLRVVIECDGHDHHDLTKEQARHDRQRDRWMQSKGLSVLRFTGSEIFKDADKCAAEVFDFVDAWWEGLSV